MEAISTCNIHYKHLIFLYLTPIVLGEHFHQFYFSLNFSLICTTDYAKKEGLLVVHLYHDRELTNKYF